MLIVQGGKGAEVSSVTATVCFKENPSAVFRIKLANEVRQV